MDPSSPPFDTYGPEPGGGAKSEKRDDERSSCQASVRWSYFNKPDLHEVLMFNHSNTGIYFESSIALVPGSAVVVRLERNPACCAFGERCSWPRTIGVGEVKWCRQIPDSDVPRYGVGVRYLLPVWG